MKDIVDAYNIDKEQVYVKTVVDAIYTSENENENLKDKLTNIVNNISDNTKQLSKNTTQLSQMMVNVKQFGAVGDGVTDDTSAIQNAINYCYQNNFRLFFPYSTYRSKNLIFKVNMSANNAIILFDEGYHFTNFEIDGSIRYDITSLKGITFESDKSRLWNSVDAGDSFDSAVIKSNVKRMYGQRVYIGNKTTTPNNILSNDITERLNGTGFWYKYYNQWNSASDINLDNIIESYNGLSNKTDTNTLTLPYGASIDCNFIGFAIGLTLVGSYNVDLTHSSFKRVKIGILTNHAENLPGALSSLASKVTTLTIAKCLFEDISFCAIYSLSLLQSTIKNNIMQPCKIGTVLIYASENDIYENYFEIGYSYIIICTNVAIKNNIRRNFTNPQYCTFQAYLRYGIKNKVIECKGLNSVFCHASITNCDFDSSCVLTKNNSYFYINGNSIERSKTKMSIFNTTGLAGTSIITNIKSSTRVDGTIPSVTYSQSGLFFNGNEEILSIELMSNVPCKLSYYDITNTGTPKVVFIDIWDNTNKVFIRKDIREAGVIYTFRVVYNDGN